MQKNYVEKNIEDGMVTMLFMKSLVTFKGNVIEDS